MRCPSSVVANARSEAAWPAKATVEEPTTKALEPSEIGVPERVAAGPLGVNVILPTTRLWTGVVAIA